jgi:predicted HAD superfamily Cof-like phosphohydrolase
VSKNWQADLVEFHKKFGHLISPVPSIPDKATMLLRTRLIEEEVGELLEALATKDLVEIADGAADSIYVILGTLESYGITLQPIWDIVHKSNMSKIPGNKDAFGKTVKPTGWTSPREFIKDELRAQSGER